MISLNVPGKNKLGTVGLPLPGVEIAIWDEQKNVVETEVIGEIMVRGPNVMQGYYKLKLLATHTISGIMLQGWRGASKP